MIMAVPAATVGAGEVIGQQAEGDRQQARADQRDDLGGEEQAVVAVGDDLTHGRSGAVRACLSR